MKIFRFAIIALFALSPFFAFAQTDSAGIPKDLMWFSKSPFYAGDTVDVYTVVYNSTPYLFTGVVELRDDTRVIGRKEFMIGPSGASEIISIPWSVSVGSHNISMSVVDQKFTFNGEVVSADGPTHIQSSRIEFFTERPPLKSVTSPSLPKPPRAEVATSTDVISSLGTQVVDRIPEPIISTAVPVFGHLEQFRINQAKSVAEVIHGAEHLITIATSTKPVPIATTTGTHLDKWGGVVSNAEYASSTPRSQMKGWDLILHGTSPSDLIHTPLQYVILFFTLIFSFIIAHAFLFYILLLLLIYKIVRLVLGIFF